MKSDTFINLYKRELNNLKKEISAYQSENDLWKIAGQVSNPAGNLCLHLCGNLLYYIGGVLGGTGYIRNRDAEFSRKNIPAADLLREIDDTIEAVENALGKVSDDDLAKEFPLDFIGQKVTTGYLLMALLAHLTYHLGQINYHRRLI